MMPREFVLPDLGEGITEAQIVRVLVKPGEQIEEDQYLIEVETDKAAVEIPSPFRGVLEDIRVTEGQTINVGDVIVIFKDGNGQVTESSDKTSKTKSDTGSTQAEDKGTETKVSAGAGASAGADQHASAPTAVSGGGGSSTVPAAPAVRKLARELGVNISSVRGTGPGGRVTREDVQSAAAGGGSSASLAVAPSASSSSQPRRPVRRPVEPPPGTPDTDKWGTIRRSPLSQIRKTIANQMTKSAFTIPHVTHGDEADISELERTRKEINEMTGGEPRITLMAFLIRAVCISLHRYPIFNASFDEERGEIIYKDYINVGIAVDTERGLIVPVIRQADQLSLLGIAQQLQIIANQVRTSQFAIEDLRGGTFTITNVGALGGTFSTPIINHPEVAILGLGRGRKVPVVKDGSLAETTVLPVMVTFDHRAADGANAARFTRDIIDYLEQPTRFLLD